MPVVTMSPCEVTSRGSPVLTEINFMSLVVSLDNNKVTTPLGQPQISRRLSPGYSFRLSESHGAPEIGPHTAGNSLRLAALTQDYPGWKVDFLQRVRYAWGHSRTWLARWM